MWRSEYGEVPLVMKQDKLRRMEKILRPEYIRCRQGDLHYDCLDDAMRSQFAVEEESGVSENPYHVPALQMIEKYKHGLVLDVGAGKRNTYYGNVVNLDINKYGSTDVVAVAERLPFWDNVFDAVHSNAVLEHVKDPFLCAEEMVRVLKPGGQIMCCVPFLQTFHACPHHYYNMTTEGLKNLFANDVDIHAVEVYEELRPITSLKLLATDYANALTGKSRQMFLDMPLRDIINMPYSGFREMGIVTEMSHESNLKMACCNTLFGVKKGILPDVSLQIICAQYGSVSTYVDCTMEIQKMVVSDRHLTISTQTNIHEIFGDPAPGQVKSLRMEWCFLDNETGSVIRGGTSTFEESLGRLRTPVVL